MSRYKARYSDKNYIFSHNNKLTYTSTLNILLKTITPVKALVKLLRETGEATGIMCCLFLQSQQHHHIRLWLIVR